MDRQTAWMIARGEEIFETSRKTNFPNGGRMAKRIAVLASLVIFGAVLAKIFGVNEIQFMPLSAPPL